jgi:hypothetical protein
MHPCTLLPLARLAILPEQARLLANVADGNLQDRLCPLFRCQVPLVRAHVGVDIA